MAEPRAVRVGVLGCGSVSRCYLPNLAASPFVELVSVADVDAERARAQAESFRVPHAYGDLAAMLAGEPFDLLVNLTSMQEHERTNEVALAHGKHVWSEKPLANSVEGGRRLLDAAARQGVRIWAAPAVVLSPQFAFMAGAIAGGRLGRVAAGHAAYGHTGPDWSAAFYTTGGGSLPDLAVYNLTTLTGLLGPARAVTAMTGIVTPTRDIVGVGEVAVTAEDNAVVVMDHGGGVLSCVQSGFNFFNPHGHDGSEETRQTVTVVGTGGAMGLVGYDWEPRGVALATAAEPSTAVHVEDPAGYVWEMGASAVAECLATGRPTRLCAEHALHVVEVMQAANASQQSGRRVPIGTSFPWPLV